MIGHFYPLVVFAAVQSAGALVVNVRSTSAATEVSNEAEWLGIGN
jgi:hypothetical protein